MPTELKARVKARVEALGKSPITLAKAVGLERGFINDIIIGRKVSVRAEKLELVAKALECDPRYLQGDIDTPWPHDGGKPATTITKMEATAAVLCYGTLEPGVWRSLLLSQQPTQVPIAPDIRFSGAPQRAYKLEGYKPDQPRPLQSGNALAVGIEGEHFVKRIGPLVTGNLVVLRRVRRKLQETELSLRRVEKVGGKTQLSDASGVHPPLTLESPPAGEALSIEAVVTLGLHFMI